jgi:hypothetical protein
MEKKAVFSGNCPCGFKFETPHGESDAIAVLKDHVGRVHPKDYPNGLTREEAMKNIKAKETSW